MGDKFNLVKELRRMVVLSGLTILFLASLPATTTPIAAVLIAKKLGDKYRSEIDGLAGK